MAHTFIFVSSPFPLGIPWRNLLLSSAEAVRAVPAHTHDVGKACFSGASRQGQDAWLKR